MAGDLRKPNLSLSRIETEVSECEERLNKLKGERGECERIMGCLDCVRIPMTSDELFLAMETPYISEYGDPALNLLIEEGYVQFTPGRSQKLPGEYSLTPKGKATFSNSR